MADDTEPTPEHRPRRRRSDVDPTIRQPRTPHGRRRSDLIPGTVAPATEPAPAPVHVAEPAPADVPAIDDEPTTRFLLPRSSQATNLSGPTADRSPSIWLPVLDGRSSDPSVCPFLRAVDDGVSLIAPIEAPDQANRCAALQEAVPQSLRQQELVCLASGHVSCPRYLRGAVVVAEAPEPIVRAGWSISPAILGSVVVLVLAFSASIAFVLARGGLAMSTPTIDPTPAPSASAVAVASVAPTVQPAVTPSAPATASPAPTASPSPSPSPTPTPTPSPTPTPAPTAAPQPTSDRYALLRPCPDAPRCWIYRVRAGDNLTSIANYFGVSLASIYERNPFVRDGLRPGQDLRLPPPTR